MLVTILELDLAFPLMHLNGEFVLDDINCICAQSLHSLDLYLMFNYIPAGSCLTWAG